MRPFCKVWEFTLSHIYLSSFIVFYINSHLGLCFYMRFFLFSGELMFPFMLDAAVLVIIS